MAKKQRRNTVPVDPPKAATKADGKSRPTHPSHNGTRETLESLAIAFILAFFIRTFVVEPFVIPTGSMSPALQGVHKDLNCPQCGQRYRVNASVDAQVRGQDTPERCVGGMCPMCRYTMAYSGEVAKEFRDAPEKSRNERSYSGDRIVVNKFIYSFTEPERWNVVVFKFPGNATDNYIKRLVGLPGETLQIYAGDLFTGPGKDGPFEIARKPPRVAYAMREPVHDTERNPANLRAAGWPLRWQADEAWEVTETETGDNRLRDTYLSSGSGDQWLRYIHTPPPAEVWPALEGSQPLGEATPKLISDFNPYNTRITDGWVGLVARMTQQRGQFPSNPFYVPWEMQGMHWVGDLFIEADVESHSDSGQLMLELVEAGHRFRVTIDLQDGVAKLSIIPQGQRQPTEQFAAQADTVVHGHGDHRVQFANVDDTLLLWVDDRLVQFDQPTTFDWQGLFGERRGVRPQTSDDDQGDLAPARVGTRDAKVGIQRLRIYRDIYYIATRSGMPHPVLPPLVTDYRKMPPADVLSNPEKWDEIGDRRIEKFDIAEDQFFVMGDNSPFSMDARLWDVAQGNPRFASKPGGNYLERQLLVGRAISVVWPHPWNYVLPNFMDMRRIR